MKWRLGLPHDDRRSIAEGIIAWGNLVFGALTLGQMVIPGDAGLAGYKLGLVMVGIIFWVGAYGIAISILRGGDKHL
jgi:hypothetical protein